MKTKILVLSASNNKEGNSATMAKWFLEGINKEKYDVEWVYLYDIPMEPFTNENRDALIEQDPRNKGVRDLVMKIQEVEHVVLTTPIWNFSVPCVLKRTIDRTMCSGRVWSETLKRKVPGWGGKKFYLLFTMGAPMHGIVLDSLAIFQVWLSLWYFGAKRKVIGVAPNAGNGSKCVIGERTALHEKMKKKGMRIFG